MGLRRPLPTWATLLVGMLLGGVLTSTFTFRMWWCSYDDLMVDRDILRIVQVNERITARKGIHSLTMLDQNSGDCVCGEELERLRTSSNLCGLSKAPVIDPSLKPSSSVLMRPTQASFSPLRAMKNDENNETFSAFLNPPNSSTGPARIEYLGTELSIKRKLLVAVLTSEKHLKDNIAIFDTWGAEVAQVFFFVGDEFNATHPSSRPLPVVRLPGVSDSPTSSVRKMFSAIKYLQENYIDTYHWFMFVSMGTYVRASKLEDLLMKLDHSAKVYLGRAASGKPEDTEKLGLLPHELYCLGTPGFVLSNALVRELSPHLEFCLGAIEQREQEIGVQTVVDVEVGRCISRKTDTQCTQSDEAKSYFVENYQKLELKQVYLDSKTYFKDLVTYHPVADPIEMQHLHYFYKDIEFSDSIAQAKFSANEASGLCAAVKASGVVGLKASCDVTTCPCEDDATVQIRCPNAGVVPTPSYAFAATNKYELQSWEYFDDTTLYNDKLVQPSYWLNVRKDTKHELQQMLAKILQAVNDGGHRMKFKKVLNGWVRHNPFRGSEYIVDAEFIDVWKKVYSKRISLVRPYASNYVTLKDNLSTETTINFIVPISNVNERFKEFMRMYEQVCLIPRENTKLILAVYGGSDVVFVESFLQPYQEKYPSASFKVMEGSGPFSRAKALHLGMSALVDQELAFMCDVDMTVTRPFLDRCRQNTISGKRVYFPEFFKLYNLGYVYRSKKRPAKIGVKRQNGHWAHYSYGMLCIHKSDYTTVGGMNTNIVGWGEEDVIFFERVLKKKLEVLRAPDTGLSHRWHDKQCPKSLPTKQHNHCLSSRGENLADRMELASYIYEVGVQIKDTHDPLLVTMYNESEHNS